MPPPDASLDMNRGRDMSSYFFCQATDSHLNNATAVLRGLVYMLVSKQEQLRRSHVEHKFKDRGGPIFQDTKAWDALCTIFTDILSDPSLGKTYIIIDALDECLTDGDKLLKFVLQEAKKVRQSPVKWIISSRNSIEERTRLECSQSILSLELRENAGSISQAIDAFIDDRISHFESLQDDSSLAEHVRQVLRRKAEGTFLYVALVVQELEKVQTWEVRQEVDNVPKGLDKLYARMIEQIGKLEGGHGEHCQLILSAAVLAYRPLQLLELGVVSGLPDVISGQVESIEKMVGMSGSFLTVRDKTVSFVHQSAKDYLVGEAASIVAPSGWAAAHRAIFERSLYSMKKSLRRDIYNLRCPGISIDDIKDAVVPDPDPLAAIRYSCIYWIDHLCDSNSSLSSWDSVLLFLFPLLKALGFLEGVSRTALINQNSQQQNNLPDGRAVCDFLQDHFLYWAEALSLCRAVSDGIVAVAKLERFLKRVSTDSDLLLLTKDARRFLLYNGSMIKINPLQAYVSALLFTPTSSVVRQRFEREQPKWVTIQPRVHKRWSALLQTLAGHSEWVNAVAFSPDGKLVASASSDNTIKLWDAGTGDERQTLAGHSGSVNAVAFSPDGKLVASASDDKTVKLWDAGTGAERQTLAGGAMIRTLSFDAMGLHLVTNMGHVKLGTASSTVTQSKDSVPLTALAHQKGYGLRPDSSWITWDEQDVICLPSELRPSSSAVTGSTIAIGCHSGCVLVLGFADGDKAPWLEA